MAELDNAGEQIGLILGLALRYLVMEMGVYDMVTMGVIFFDDSRDE